VTRPRLEPIERPRHPLLRFAYWISRRRLGVVMTPLKVAYARAPKLALLGWRITTWVEKGTHLEPSLRLLVQADISAANGCGFCLDIARAMAVESHVGLDKFEALSEWATSPLFSERERAALAWAEEVTRHVRASDVSFERLRKSFDEREIVELTALVAIENYYNRIAIPLGLESDGLCALAQRRAAA
jgi:alkylhydroperoxidase family enzyme